MNNWGKKKKRKTLPQKCLSHSLSDSPFFIQLPKLTDLPFSFFPDQQLSNCSKLVQKLSNRQELTILTFIIQFSAKERQITSATSQLFETSKLSQYKFEMNRSCVFYCSNDTLEGENRFRIGVAQHRVTIHT